MAKRKGNTRRKRKGRKKERCRRNGESCFWRFLQLSLSALGISLTHSFATLFSRVDIYLFAPLSISPFSAASKNVPLLFARTDCVHEIIIDVVGVIEGHERDGGESRDVNWCRRSARNCFASGRFVASQCRNKFWKICLANRPESFNSCWRQH